MSTSQDRGWGPGYPTDRRRDMTKVTQGDVSLWVHREIAPLVAHLVAETTKRGYKLRAGECWGYCNRAIRGTNRPSNHSWGLAVDLNAPANPMGSKLVTDMPDWMTKLWTDFGFRWGGSYSGRKDAMHYEFMGTPAEARERVADLKADVIEVRVPPNEVAPVFNPPIVTRPIIDALRPPEGGVVLVADNGDTYAWGGAQYPGPKRGHPKAFGPHVLEPIVDEQKSPDGGIWLVAASGAVYAYGGAPFVEGANGQKYFEGRRAAQIVPSDADQVPADLRTPGRYCIIATSGEVYGPVF